MRRVLARSSALLAAALAGVLLACAAAGPASAATTSQWATWSPLTGSSGDYTGAVQFANTPALRAELTTDSRSGQVGVISGASTWIAAGTPVGQKYGSSQGRPYLNLRPKADTATAPSTTIYSFDEPTPTSGWTFVLGDIDADQVRIRALGPDGSELTAAQLGYRGGFNYCAPGLAGKPSCTADAADIPVWDPAALTLTGNDAASDTAGASGWFEPSAPISSLELVFTRRSGFPVYQTWFASLARDITGVVTADSGSVAGVVLTLTDRTGRVVATTTTGADGAYSFPGVQASDGYTVSATPPDGRIVDGASFQPADLSATDARVDFALRDIVPVAVSGRVTDPDGAPIAGAVVTVPGVGSVTTGPNGTYIFDEVPAGTYQATVEPPAGYSIASTPPPFTVAEDATTPIGDVDFVLAAEPSLSGRVTAAGQGEPGVVVVATGPGGPYRTVTDGDGDYRLPRLPDGAYTVSIETPDGLLPAGPVSRNVAVTGEDVTGVDFALAREGVISGAVTAGGAPVPGVTLTITGPDGSVRTVTDTTGAYALGSLPPGDYTVAVTAPPGYRVDGAASRTVTITAAGEIITGQDFALASTAPTTPPAGPGATGPAGELADSGSSVPTGVLDGGAAAVVLGAGAVTVSGVRRRVRRG